MAPTYKIAAIQLHSEPLESEHNFLRASSFIRDAASHGADLAVLPEYHLTGWVPESVHFRTECARWRSYLSRYQALAAHQNINIVPGTIVQTSTEPSTGSEILINVAYFITTSGSIAGAYQKKNLWHPERPYLTSSAHAPHEVISTPVGKVGLLICWDLAFPKHFGN